MSIGPPQEPKGGATMEGPTRKIDYDNRRFRAVQNADNGESGADTVFHYRQEEGLVWATYAGGRIRFGTLVALVDGDGSLDMRYQHVSDDGSFKGGVCRSVPEVLADGRLRLHETWRWTMGAEGQGTSIVEEID